MDISLPVAITYLHHTHPEVHHFEAESWSFVKGALATVDRDFGFVGRHLFHGIIDTHVVHHLFPLVSPSPRLSFLLSTAIDVIRKMASLTPLKQQENPLLPC